MRAKVSLSAVAAVDQLQGYAFVVLTPEIAASLHVSTNGIAAVSLARGVGFVVVGAAIGALVRRGHARRVARCSAAARAGALVLGSVATTATVAAGLAAYGAAGTSVAAAHPRLLPPAHREAHRLAGRLGNAAVPLAVAALALVFSWSMTFVLLAVVALAFALLTLTVGPADHGEDDADRVLYGLRSIPGGHFALSAIAVATLAELPIYVVVFSHLATEFDVTVLERALLIAVGEVAGVVANLALGQRTSGLRERSPQSLGAGLVAAALIGLLSFVAAMAVSTVGPAIVLLCIGTAAMSVIVPVMTLGTRAVLAGGVPRRAALGVTGAFAALLLLGPANDAATVAALSVLPLCAIVAVARTGVRSPTAVAEALRDVAKVTPEERMLGAPPALDQV